MITGNQYLLFIALIPAAVVFFMLSFGLVALILGLFLNAKILMSKESRRFANSLTFVLGIGLSIFWVISLIEPLTSSRINSNTLLGSSSYFYIFICRLI